MTPGELTLLLFAVVFYFVSSAFTLLGLAGVWRKPRQAGGEWKGRVAWRDGSNRPDGTSNVSSGT